MPSTLHCKLVIHWPPPLAEGASGSKGESGIWVVGLDPTVICRVIGRGNGGDRTVASTGSAASLDVITNTLYVKTYRTTVSFTHYMPKP